METHPGLYPGNPRVPWSTVWKPQLIEPLHLTDEDCGTYWSNCLYQVTQLLRDRPPGLEAGSLTSRDLPPSYGNGIYSCWDVEEIGSSVFQVVLSKRGSCPRASRFGFQFLLWTFCSQWHMPWCPSPWREWPRTYMLGDSHQFFTEYLLQMGGSVMNLVPN